MLELRLLRDMIEIDHSQHTNKTYEVNKDRQGDTGSHLNTPDRATWPPARLTYTRPGTVASSLRFRRRLQCRRLQCRQQQHFKLHSGRRLPRGGGRRVRGRLPRRLGLVLWRRECVGEGGVAIDEELARGLR